MSVKHDKINQAAPPSFAEDAERQVRSRATVDLDLSDSDLHEPHSLSSQRQLIPPRLKVLFVSAQRPVWVSLALRLDAVGCTEPRLEWASTSEEALTLLRNDSFDCLLLRIDSETKTNQLELLNAIRMSGCHEPVVLMLASPDDQVVLAACENQAEVLISPALWESPALLGVMQRAMWVHELQEQNHRLQVDNHRRLVRERDEAERLLNQQRNMVEELQTLAEPNEFDESERDLLLRGSQVQTGLPESSDECLIPQEVQDYYHELLRTYVIMGSGSLKEEILQIAELLAAVNLTPHHVLEFHLECVEVIVRGLGNRSSRHVMSRADLLALEMMIHLGECYQKNSD
ncbi:hypothetical protein [uncultured Gimesia sp.]|uniref:hypothetical protein n=1 Tax=uncultured Gimesia sp. TaxID=1678688 RepID=UPI0030DA6B52|tara:strand:+ start:73130 stop:74164 length:1035 start_codon:yes stop_codon:yes gene_type:complete